MLYNADVLNDNYPHPYLMTPEGRQYFIKQMSLLFREMDAYEFNSKAYQEKSQQIRELQDLIFANLPNEQYNCYDCIVQRVNDSSDCTQCYLYDKPRLCNRMSYAYGCCKSVEKGLDCISKLSPVKPYGTFKKIKDVVNLS
jgi:hypothetical protein